MRILITAINYAPEESGNAPYTTGLAEHLVKGGNEVHVLTGYPHYPAWRRVAAEPEERDGAFNGVFVHRRWHYIPSSQSSLRRALYEASFFGSASLGSSPPRPDAIVGIVPSLSGGLIARLASRRFRSPYGVIFQDLMSKAATQSGISGGSSVAAVVRQAEGWVARGAAGIGIVSDGFRPYIESLGVRSGAVSRVRNWALASKLTVEQETVREGLGWRSDSFVCLHAGNMGFKQGLESVLAAARASLTVAPQFRYVLMGDGSQRRRLEEIARREGLENVDFLPSQPAETYGSVLAAADALLLNQREQVTDMAFPSKLGSYVAAGRPIIACVSPSSEAGRELAENGAALIIEPGSVDKFVAGLFRLSSEEHVRHRLVEAARAYGERAFSRETALTELEAFVFRTAGVEFQQDREESFTEVA